MATAYTEGDTLGSGLLAALQTAILASGDWARPNSGTYPTLYKATTTDGAQMCVDINTTALTLSQLGYTFYRTHDGTTGVDPLARSFRMKRNATGSLAANTYHWRVSAGKDHLYIDIEGPRPGEANPDQAAYGSQRNYLFMSALEPYYDTVDTTPAVIAGGGQVTGQSSSTSNYSHQCYASRNGTNTLSWTPGHLAALCHPVAAHGQDYGMNEQRISVLDPDRHYTPSPYVFFDNTQGMRGRLMRFHFAGYTYSPQISEGPAPQVGLVIDIDGVDYKLLQVSKSDGTGGGGEHVWGSFGLTYNYGTPNSSVVVAVPHA